ncbi:ubiquitin carboxyl-terminal hydrolase 35-like [Daphnia pulicaria]|uniref:ubiquitin carboxyl-terminal hydrolase 35-like n=1 Tax=Daphnia pulicaria TaxID=35523 RepID=UPI001EEBF706|nr:ubiquitin carboxyl-terminal hydrolase 35-like [Daphnia pulicaria]
MERLLEIIRSDSSDQDKGDTINSLLDEVFVQGLSEEDYFVIVNYCLRSIALPKNQNELGKEATVKIMSKLNSFRKNEFNDISLQVVSELISPDANEPVDILATSKELLTIGFLEDVVSTEFSDNVLKILQRLRGKLSLSVLVDIANVTQSNPKCLPPQQQLQQFCTEIINQVSSLSIPVSQLISFMQDVMAVANMVQRIWLTSPGDIVLSCLANIYTLIADSSASNPPSQSLAAFLNVTPTSQIEIALEKLLMLAGLSNSDKLVVKLAIIFCDWLLQWPKATKISNWILSLFKMLTLDGRSSIVAEVISLKAPKLMEQSIIPVIRGSTAPVLPYLLLTMRDQPQEKVEPILKPAITLVNILKIQPSKDNETQYLRTELVEGLYVLSEKLPQKEDQLYQALLRTISDYPRPSDQRILSRLDSVPALFDSRFSKDCNAPIILNSNWLESRTTTGKIGLINLGNTCYINSILQALYMNYDFTRSVLGSITTNHQNVLSQLQQVLIFLRYSFRAAYSPAAFIKASRPPWFETGRQQDCSEFLRYLMDSLYEQEKADRSVLQCGHRWTVGVSKEVTDEVEPENEDESEKANIELQRWVTEEDLTVGLAIPEEKLPVDKCIQVADSLSNVHSDSTETVDSGIQSVVDGQEDKVKSCSELDNQQPDRKQQLSLIHKIFGGKMTTTYRCLACGTESHHQDFFTDLHLAFPDPVSSTVTRVTRQLPSPDTEGLSLDSLLKFYFTAEKLQGENRYHCDNCAELVQEAERILCVTEAPQHLLLSLLRFHYDRLLQRRGKITTQVSYPQRLELPIEGGTTVTYVLYAVVIHSGVTLDGGHYYTLARSSDLSPEDILGNGNSTEPWFMFNDSQVSRTDFESLISLSRKYPTDTPYLLWYRRVSDDQDGSFPDQGKSTPSVPLILPTDLKRMVDEDNAKFVQERLRNISRPIRSSWMPPKKDDDQDPHRRDPFQDNSGSRFIF